MTINVMFRTIHKVIEYSPNIQFAGENKKVLSLIKYVTGKNKSYPKDYEIVITDPHYGYDTVTIKGRKGFIRVSLTPLFQEIE